MFPEGPDRFETTHWSVVLAARDNDSAVASLALSELCRTYWYPLYAYVRRQGYDVEDARDLTQAFLASLVERKDLRRVTPEKGRFRSFLLGSIRHFLLNEIAKRKTTKRGWGMILGPPDFDVAEQRYLREPSDPVAPDVLFDRRWAIDLLDRVLQRLRRDWGQSGRARDFDLLKDSLIGESVPGGYRTLANELNTTEGAVKVTVHRLRRQYRRYLRREIAETVSSADAVDDELRYLFAALRR